MYETRATVVGNVITKVDERQLADGTVVASFRVASNERRFDRSAGRWVDGDRFIAGVTCWRRLAENVHASLVVGDPVMVTGRIYTRSYESQGQIRSVTEIEAQAVAPDLSRCTAVVRRNQRRVEVAAVGTGERAEGPPAEPSAGELATAVPAGGA